MDQRVEALLKRPQLQQLSVEWFAARPSLITASSAASLLVRDSMTCDKYIETYKLEDIFDKDGKCCNPYSSKTQYFLDRCRGSKFTGSAATFFGQKYESVASDIYSNITGEEVLEFGLLVHPTIPLIAASPDGITPSGIMIEIKCPYRRAITGIPPLYYYFQCQLQLEVCDLEICDFTEFSFTEFESEEEWLDDTTLEFGPIRFRGLFIQTEVPDSETGEFHPKNNKYIYPERNLLDNSELLISWAKENKDRLDKENDGSKKISITYWKVFNHCITRIVRNPDWFKNVLPVFEKEWKRLQFYKKGDNYKHLLQKKQKTDNGKAVTLNSFSSNGSSGCILSDDSE